MGQCCWLIQICADTIFQFTKFEGAQMSLLRSEFLLLLQMAWLRKFLAVFAVGTISISSAPAATISIDFEGPSGFVNNYYNGGTDSTGASGPNLGVSFLDFLVDGDDIFFITQFPNNFATNAFLAFMDVPAGFTALSLAVHPGTGVLINAWSGLDGSGSQVGSNILLPATSAGFETIDVPLTGTAESVQFIAPDGHLSVDDIRITTITSVSDTPLPGTLALFTTGLGALGLLLGWRRKQKT
jgi:hypothetical protein